MITATVAAASMAAATASVPTAIFALGKGRCELERTRRTEVDGKRGERQRRGRSDEKVAGPRHLCRFLCKFSELLN
jgi:hypothetical protein